MDIIDYTLIIQKHLAIQPILNGRRTKPGKLDEAYLPLAHHYSKLVFRNGIEDRNGFVELGELLYKILLKPVENSFLSLDVWPQIITNDSGNIFLRCRLLFEAEVSKEIISLPWEFLYIQEGSSFLGTDPRVGFSLGFDNWLNIPINSSLVDTASLKVLLVSVRPKNLPGIALSPVQEAINNLVELSIEFAEPLENPSIEDLQIALQSIKPNILHIVSHGMFDSEGYIAMLDREKSEARWYDDVSFSDLFRAWKPTLVLLQVCEAGRMVNSDRITGLSSWLVQQFVASVVSMRYPFLQKDGWKFARQFYKTLAENHSIDQAVQSGRLALADNGIGAQSHNVRDFACPTLWMRLQDGLLISQATKNQTPLFDISITQTHFENDYLEQVAHEYGYLYTDGVDHSKINLSNVFKMLRAVIIPSDTVEPNSALWIHPTGQMLSRQIQNTLPISLDTLIVDTPQLAILGDPGSGKSTILRYLTYSYATKPNIDSQSTTLNRVIPI
ncbi:MAG: CHAT domain-containing protein, partial [Acidobacteriota bacterium]